MSRKVRDWVCALLVASVALSALGAYYVDATFRYLNGNVNGAVNPAAPPYLGDATGATDSWTAFQSAAVSAGLAPNVAIPAIQLPEGTFALSRPWVLSTNILNSSPISQPRVYGAGRQGTIVKPTFVGPAIVASAFYTPTNYGVSIAPAIVGSGSSILFGAGSGPWGSSNAGAYFDLNENLPPTIGSFTDAGYFNGLSQWTIQFFFKDNDTTNMRCVWGSNGAWIRPKYTSGALFGLGRGGMGYFCVNASGKGIAMLDVGGTDYVLTGSATITQGSIYEGELNLDGSGNINFYYGTGGTVTRQAQQAGTSGTITQRVDENHTLGAACSAWPYSGCTHSWAGNIQSVRISNTARHTGPSFTQDTGNFANDGNTLFLWNFDLSEFPTAPGSAQVLPIAQTNNVAGVTAGNSWLALHDYQTGCCGGMVTLSDFSVLGSETVDILGNAVALDAERISPSAKYVGIETTPNSSFGSVFKDIYGIGMGDTSQLWALGGISHIQNFFQGTGAYPLVVSGGLLDDIFYSVNTTTLCGIALDNTNGISPVTVNHLDLDAENNGIFPPLCIRSEDGGNFTIDGSSIEAGNTAPQPFAQIIGDPQITLSNNVFSGLSANPGMPIVDSTWATTVFNESAFVVFGPNNQFQINTPGNNTWPQPLEAGFGNNFLTGGNNASYLVIGQRCSGQVTLSTGAGVFSDPCINMTATPVATCQPAGDTTTPVNAFKVAPPIAGRVVTDGVLASSTTVTSATAAFVAGDIGRRIHGAGIPDGSTPTFITARGSATSITISNAATATATGVTLTFDASSAVSAGTGTDVVNVSCQ